MLLISHARSHRRRLVKNLTTADDQQNDWIQSQLAVGNYASDSQLLRDLIRKEQEKLGQIAQIRKALDDAELSGISNRSPKDIMNIVTIRHFNKPI